MAPGSLWRLLDCCGKGATVDEAREDKAQPFRQVTAVITDTSSPKKSAKPPTLATPSTEEKTLSSGHIREIVSAPSPLVVPAPDKAATGLPFNSNIRGQDVVAANATDQQSLLWDEAYEQLDQGVRKEYEELLNAELSSQHVPNTLETNYRGQQSQSWPHASPNASQAVMNQKPTQAQLKGIICRGTKRMEQKQIRYTIAGHEFILDTQISNAAEFLLWGKDIVDAAVTASTEASLVWAGVCLILPLLTHPLQAREANEDGFVYVTSRLEFYTAFEKSLLLDRKKITRTENQTENLRGRLIGLYQAVLDYQIRTVLRFYKSAIRRVAGDVRDPKIWEKLVKGIQNTETLLYSDLKVITDHDMASTLESLEQHSESSGQRMQGLLKVAADQLLILEQIRDIGQISLDLKKYGLQIQQDAMFDGQNVGSIPCQKNTRVSIRKEIIDWAYTTETSTVFWLHGLAGMGKSTISQSVAKRCSDSGQLGGTYFFKRSGRSKANLFFSTIITSLVRSIPPLEKYVHQSIDKERSYLGDEKIENKKLDMQFEILIFRPLLQMISENNSIKWTRILVIDGLDECEDDDDVYTICQQLCKLHSLHGLRIHVLVTSRDESRIRTCFQAPEMASVVRTRSLLDSDFVDESKDDIRAYLKECMVDVKRRREVSELDWPSSDQFESLFSLATTPSPLFIYVATLYRSLRPESSETAEGQLKRWIANKHKGSQLTATYGPVLDRVSFLLSGDDTKEPEKVIQDKKKLNRILSAIVLLATPLPMAGLAKLLCLPFNEVRNWIKNLHSVFYVETEHEDTVRVLHTSFRDFLIHEARLSKVDIRVDEHKGHQMLAKSCLQLMSTLEENIPKLDDVDTSISELKPGRLKASLPPEVQYACLYWVDHIEKGFEEGYALLDEDDHLFLRTHFLHWLEAMAWMGKLSQAIVAVQKIEDIVSITARETIVSKSKIPSLSAFVYDMKRFALFCRSDIEENPLRLYYSSLIFAPTGSLVRQQFLPPSPKCLLRRSNESSWSPLIQSFRGHTGSISGLTMSTRTGHLASVSEDKTILLWDPNTGAILQRLDTPEEFWCATFSPSGKILALGSTRGTVALLDLGLGRIVSAVDASIIKDPVPHLSDSERMYMSRVYAPEKFVSRLCYSATGQFLAALWGQRSVTIWRITAEPSLEAPTTLDLPFRLEISSFSSQSRNSSSPSAIAFAPQSDFLAVGTRSGDIIMWNPKKGERVWTTTAVSKDKINTLAFSCDGETLAACAEKKIILLGTSNGSILDVFCDHTDYVTAISFSPYEPDLIASNSADGVILLWKVSTGEHLSKIIASRLEHLVFLLDPSSRRLASIVGRQVDIWDMALNSIPDRESHNGIVAEVAVSPNLSAVVTCAKDVIIWDANTGAMKHRSSIGEKSINHVSFAWNGKLLVLLRENITEIWDPESGTNVFEAGMENFTRRFFPLNDRFFVLLPITQSGEGLRLWDVERRDFGTEISVPPDFHITSTTIAMSPDNRLIAMFISTTQKLCLYDANTGGHLKNLDTSTTRQYVRPSKMMFSPESNRIVIHTKNDLFFWTLERDEPPQKHHFDESVHTLAYSPKNMLAVGVGQEVRLINATTWEDVKRFHTEETHFGFCVRRMSFSPDGKVLTTNIGLIDVENLSFGLFIHGSWICRGTDKLLRLPYGKMPWRYDFGGGIFVFGYMDGPISIIQFI